MEVNKLDRHALIMMHPLFALSLRRIHLRQWTSSVQGIFTYLLGNVNRSQEAVL